MTSSVQQAMERDFRVKAHLARRPSSTRIRRRLSAAVQRRPSAIIDLIHPLRLFRGVRVHVHSVSRHVGSYASVLQLVS